ncbi:MAG: hypothetical protein WC658_04910 [Candidatus Omnitrophota bacterium]
MKKAFFVWAGLVFVLGRALAQEAGWQSICAENTHIQAVLTDADNPAEIYFGKSSGIFKSEDSGGAWRSILSVRGENKSVNFLAQDPENKNSLYAATGNGLYFSPDKGKNWRRVFQGKNYFEKDCTAIAILPEAIYLGTKSGLFASVDRGRTWQKESGDLSNTQILNIVSLDAIIYAAAANGVFKQTPGSPRWERIFAATPADNNDSGEEISEEQDEGNKISKITYAAIDPHNAAHLYVATHNGIYESQNLGLDWQALPDYGLFNRKVDFLIVSQESRLFAANKWGIFEFGNGRWYEISAGLPSNEINFLLIDKTGNVYAAMELGLFRMRHHTQGVERAGANGFIETYSQDEPKINEVQQEAIKYAEVGQDKISRWRNQAAKRAILPKVTVGMDRDLDRTTSSNIWGIYSSNGTPGRHYIGPDDISKDDNRNWSVSLTWELGDLIWSDDQTNIDVRSRLMVQLRDDILGEVTKLYFERLRVKMELDNLSIEERKKRFEKELKLQELTASIDALTGGYFSEQIKKQGLSPS